MTGMELRVTRWKRLVVKSQNGLVRERPRARTCVWAATTSALGVRLTSWAYGAGEGLPIHL